MKISTKGRYGLTVMIALAKENDRRPLSLKKIAARHELPEHYLEQLIGSLRNGGLVRSVRGAYGGYQLVKAPEDITAGEMLRLLEGPLVIVEESDADGIVKRKLWDKMQAAIEQVLDETTLADLAADDDDSYMFYI